MHGAALATSVSQILMFSTLIAYILIFKPHGRGTWCGPSRDAFKQLGQYMTYAVPGAGMLTLEWWCYEVIGILAGTMGTLLQA